MDKSHSFSNALELQESIRAEYELRGFGSKRVAYVSLLDMDANIRVNKYSHRWAFLESDEDFYSIAYTRSTSSDPHAPTAPERLLSQKHVEHECAVMTKTHSSISRQNTG